MNTNNPNEKQAGQYNESICCFNSIKGSKYADGDTEFTYIDN